MKFKSFLICLFFLAFNIKTYCQEKTHALSFKISIAEEVNASFKQKGRLFIFISTNPDVEPRRQISPSHIVQRHYIFAKNFSDWNANETLSVQDSEDWATWSRTQECTFKDIPDDTYYIQLLWDQNFEKLGINAAGNIYSKKQEIKLTSSQTLTFKLSEIIESFKLVDHKLLKLVNHKSDTLSKWWKKPVYERAAVLLPSKYYENPGKEYPIRYNVIWGSGSLNAVNNFVNDTTFLNWWLSDEAPQIINIFLDGELNGNIYHVDSDNKGPFGYSLINEFIPYLENLYRGTDSPATRFIDGCSTGGWSSLALQLFYPETFNGVISYSPDPVSYKQFFTLNMYEDKNLFYNQFGYQRPVVRTRIDNAIVSMKDWTKLENLLGYSGTYIDSDRNLGILSTIFGPKGTDGKPIPLFDYQTGIIDPEAVESWSRYDLANYVKDNWATIGSKLQGKIYIWAGTQDPYYLNNGVLGFAENLSELRNPKPEAKIEFVANGGHCDNYSNRLILERIAKKIGEMNK